MLFSSISLITFALTLVSSVSAESHVIQFKNNCGKGTPVLSQNFKTISSGQTYTAQGPFEAAIAYLDTGCGSQGTGCSIVEMTLKNGAISSADVSLIPPHTFNVATGFKYINACAGTGTSCTSASCPVSNAFHKTNDYAAQRQCNQNNAGLLITFC